MKTNKKKGQSLTEYLILTALIAVGSIAVVQLVSHNIRAKFAVISEAIRGEERSDIVGDQVERRHYQTLDMKDFARDAKYGEGRDD